VAHDIASGGNDGSDWSLGDDMGSVFFPVKEQRVLYDKIDDVRFDVRRASGVVSAGVWALAGGVALLGIAGLYNAAKGRKH
jgi:hypothetical protein